MSEKTLEEKYIEWVTTSMIGNTDLLSFKTGYSLAQKEIILEIERTLNDLSKKPLLLRCDWDQGNINALFELRKWMTENETDEDLEASHRRN